MTIKRSIIIISISFLYCLGLTFFAFRFKSNTQIDVVAVNDIAQTLAEHWDKPEQVPFFSVKYGIEYVVIDNNGNFIMASSRDLNEDINSAIRHRDTIVDITRDNIVLGKLIIYNDSGERLERYRKKLLTFVLVILSTAAIFCILYTIYYDRTIFRPFRKLQGFARQVAEGKLDIPLQMDKDNLFGAFTESFDLMREEIDRARINEKKANQEKKELVASLSHDIKTPVASIKAVSDLMYAITEDNNLKKQIDIVNAKADQINTLITNLFNATLEELQELKVTVTEYSSQRLYDLIKKADYNNLVTISKISECLILADELRLAQVFDNIISNSYKYAGTSIEVSAQTKGRFLEVIFKDYGPGVPEEERTLIFNKFYRAKNASDKSGTGLGLYISKFIMNRMSGEIDCQNTGDGFAVKLLLKIV